MRCLVPGVVTGQGVSPWGPGSSWGGRRDGPMGMGMGGGFMGTWVRTLTALAPPRFDAPSSNMMIPHHQNWA